MTWHVLLSLVEICDPQVLTDYWGSEQTTESLALTGYSYEEIEHA